MKKLASLFLFALLLAGCRQAQEPVDAPPTVEFDLLSYLEENHSIKGVNFQVEELENGRYALILIPQDEEWDLRFHYQATHDEQREYADFVLESLSSIIDDLGTRQIKEAFWRRLNYEPDMDLLPLLEEAPTVQVSAPTLPVPSASAPAPNPAFSAPTPAPTQAETEAFLAKMRANLLTLSEGAGPHAWSPEFLDRIDLNKLYSDYVEDGNEPLEPEAFAQFVNENAPVMDGWEDLIVAHVQRESGHTIIRFEALEGSEVGYQAYVIYEGAEIPYITVNARTGWYHG